jgi:hypothetical protein
MLNQIILYIVRKFEFSYIKVISVNHQKFVRFRFIFPTSFFPALEENWIVEGIQCLFTDGEMQPSESKLSCACTADPKFSSVTSGGGVTAWPIVSVVLHQFLRKPRFNTTLMVCRHLCVYPGISLFFFFFFMGQQFLSFPSLAYMRSINKCE